MNKFVYVLATSGVIALAQSAQAANLKVTIENIAPTNGVYLTPVWVGFHNGSFDSYNGGLSTQPGLESLAEDGDTSQISADFLANLTYIDNSGGTPVSSTLPSSDAGLAQVGTRVDGTLGGTPIAPGQTVSQLFKISKDDSNRYFSYASMVLPTNDYFVANGNPTEIDLSSLFNSIGDSITFNIGTTVNDAGTEVNDFNFSAGNGLFGLPGGQSGPNQGTNEGGVIANVNELEPFASFANIPGGFDLSSLNFNNLELYPNGIARVTITSVQVPESSSVNSLLILGFIGMMGTVITKVRTQNSELRT